MTPPAKRWRRYTGWRYADQLILGLVVIAIGCANLVWIMQEGRGPHWDMARHLWTSLNYFHLARDGNVTGFITSYFYYPPLLYWLVVPWYLLFGTGLSVAIAANVVFVAILAFSVYGIGKTLWGRQAGLLAALLILGLPMMVSQFKEFQIDAPLTALVALGLYVLIKTEEFANTRYSILLGLAIGAGLLTKWTYALILALPLATAAGQGLFAAIRHRQTGRLINLWLALSAAYVVAGFWYLINQYQLRIDLLSNGVAAGAREGDPAVGSFAANTWYLVCLVNRQLYFIPFLMLIAGLVITFRNKSWLRRNLYPLLLLIGTLLFFTLLRNKDSRYTLPMLSAASVIAVFWLAELPARWRRLASALVAVYALLSFALISFGPRRSDLVILPASADITVFGFHGYIIGPPSGEHWHQAEAFSAIEQSPGPAPKVVYVDTLDTIWFNQWGNQYYGLREGVALSGKLSDAGFLLSRQAGGTAVPQGFERIGRWTEPDGTVVALDRRRQ